MKITIPQTILDRLNHPKLASLRDRSPNLPFVLIVLGCSLVLSLVFSGPQPESSDKEEVFTEDFNFPDIRDRGSEVSSSTDPSKVAGTEAQGPVLRDIERIPMPDPDFGLPKSETLPGASSYPTSPSYQPEVVEQKAPEADNGDWVLVEPEAPRRVERKPQFNGVLDRARFQCNNPILETLGQIAVVEVERSCGVQISYKQDSDVVINSGDRIGVQFDLKVPTPPSGACAHKCKPAPCLEGKPISNIASVIVRSIWEELR